MNLGIFKDGDTLFSTTTGTVGSITNTTVQLNNSAGTWTDSETVTGPEKQPTGTVASIGGTTATLERGTDTGGWVNGVNVTGSSGTIPSGTVGSITGTSVALSSSNDAWVDGVEVTGPLKDKVEANVTKYLKFDSSGNVTDLLDAPQDPAYETTDESPSLTLTFPSTFGSGLAPDDELGAGTTLTVEATASNTAGTSATKSAEVMPDSGLKSLNGLVTLYSGTDTDNTKIVTGANLKDNGGMVWLKSRTNTGSHSLYDTERGVGKYLMANEDRAQGDVSPRGIQSFNNDGFTIMKSSSNNDNNVGQNYVAWTFEKAAGFFDVVKQNVGNGDTVINHNLGRNPTFIIGKDIGSTSSWFCWHVGIPESQYLRLESGNPAQNATIYSLINENNFTLKNGAATGTAGEWIFYLFANNPDNGIACGTYVGNGSTTGPVITTGFEPQWVMLKRVNGTGTMNWSMFDNARGFSSGLGVSDGKLLQANTTGNEQDDKTIVALSDGFQIADNGGTINDDGQSHIYIAIAKPTTRSMTQEEFNAEAVKMATYNNRRDVHQGELAKEQRAHLAKVLEDQYGVTPEMIGEQLPPYKSTGAHQAQQEEEGGLKHPLADLQCNCWRSA